MKLSKIYTNKPEKFEPIEFNDGLNIILGEMRLPENKDKDTHNLGKTTLLTLIDFCLLKKKASSFFLYKHNEIFKGFTFFLELKLNDNSYLTIRRSPKDNTRISFIKHSKKNMDFSNENDENWDHLNIPIKRAKDILDGVLNISFVKPWKYRIPLGYTLRTESDYKDLFRLDKFRGKDKDWKPYIAKILGLNSELLKERYDLKDEKENINKKITELKLSNNIDNLDKINGLILIKEDEIKDLKEEADKFNFYSKDLNINMQLVDEIDKKLSNFNKNRYYLTHTIDKIEFSLKNHKVIFNPNEAKDIFEETGIFFEGQIKKTYDELIQFNKDITKERSKYLKVELKNHQEELEKIKTEISELNKKREEYLSFLGEKDHIKKYKSITNEIIEKESILLNLKHQKENLIKIKLIKERETKVKNLLENNEKLISENIKNSEDKNSVYSLIKLKFNKIIKTILNKDALISININGEGNLDFAGEILNKDGIETSESGGKTYKKLLCIAFDIAINQIHLEQKFTHFSFHDGFLENLDDRKQENFINYLRESTKNGYQYIGTLIDSDLPSKGKEIFTEDEIILTLHDDENGTLFKGIEF